MKKCGVVAVFLFLALTFISTTQAIGKEDAARTISEFCSAFNDLGLTHGGCVAFFTANNIVPHNASICQDESVQILLGVTNPGQCVKKLNYLHKERSSGM